MPEAADPIDRMNNDASAVVAALDRAQEASLRSAADDIFRRALVLAIGSYFENRIVTAIEAFCHKRSASDIELCAFVRNKALIRQYHSFFDWKASNANKFLSLFGKVFQEVLENKAKSDAGVGEGVRKFMQLGALRNEIAHGNFAEIKFDQSRDDIVRDYRNAVQFVAALETALGVART